MANEKDSIDWNAIRADAADAHYLAWSVNTAARKGWDTQEAHNQGMTDAVIAVVCHRLGLAFPPGLLTGGDPS